MLVFVAIVDIEIEQTVHGEDDRGAKWTLQQSVPVVGVVHPFGGHSEYHQH